MAKSRKLLEIIFTIYKSGKPYEKNYLNKEGEDKQAA